LSAAAARGDTDAVSHEPDPSGPARGVVTAIVVGYNSARHLAALAQALKDGSLVPDRLLLVDNDSADDTVIQAKAAGFEVHETGRNDGFGTACNEGLRLAQTDYVLICNPDVRPRRDALELLLTAAWASPRAAIVGAACDRPLHARRFSTIAGNVWGFLPGRLKPWLERLSPEVRVRPDGPQPVDYVVGAFMLCRVEALCDVDGFDERFFLYSEEEDLCRRLGERGWQTLLVPEAEVGHEDRGSSEGVRKSAMAAFYLHSVYRYYRKHRSRTYAELARCVLAACVLLDRAYRALARRPQVYELAAAVAPFRDIEALRRDLVSGPRRR
jgi:N-acetylglucosaminyl-diphospho-decaprenol L-rhamnosyltransferase